MYKIREILLLTALLLMMAMQYSIACDDNDDDDDDEDWRDKCRCPVEIEASDNNINIGNFVNGYSGSEIPGTGGESNFIEFTIYNYYRANIIVNAEFDNIPENNDYVMIDGWRWDFMHRDSPTAWSGAINDINNIQANLKLIRNRNKRCESYVRVRLTLNHISVSPNASAGSASLVVVISATCN